MFRRDLRHYPKFVVKTNGLRLTHFTISVHRRTRKGVDREVVSPFTVRTQQTGRHWREGVREPATVLCQFDFAFTCSLLVSFSGASSISEHLYFYFFVSLIVSHLFSLRLVSSIYVWNSVFRPGHYSMSHSDYDHCRSGSTVSKSSAISTV